MDGCSALSQNLRPFDVFENEDVIPHVKYTKMEVESLKKYLEFVVKVVEKRYRMYFAIHLL